jgi:RimJ/RimL family protein N-acetyltransferase
MGGMLTLEHTLVRLEPLRADHVAAFWAAAKEGIEDTFQWIPYAMASEADFDRWVTQAFDEQSRGVSVVFATVVRATGAVVGSTRFMNIDRANRHVEIGSTWIAPAWQRTAVNTEAKYLMLRHAFESWQCLRVEFKTDALNQRSRSAILRLGAQQEGIFRKHMLTHTGRVRDSVYFSILDTEWPAVKGRLEAALSR